MLTKRNLILLGLLCLQVVLIVVFYLPRPQGGPAKVFFEGIKPEVVTRLTVATPDGRTVTVVRQDKGWIVDTPAHYPADRAKIDILLTRLAGLRSDRLVAQTKEAHNRFQVGTQFGQKVTLTVAAGTAQSLYLGSSPNHTTTHVRAEGDDRVYLVNDLAGWQLPADEKFWWQREYLVAKPEELREISVINRAGTIRLVKSGEGWQLGGTGTGQALDAARVQEFVNAVSRIALIDYLGQEAKKEYGLEKPVAVLTLTGKSGTVTLVVGAKSETAGQLGGSYVMKSTASPFYVRGGGGILAPLTERKAVDFLAAGAMETPATP